MSSCRPYRSIVWITLFFVTACGFAMASDIEPGGFVEARYGMRTQDDPFEDERSLSELRLQLSAIAYHDLLTLEAKADILYDDLATDREDVDLENGHGFLDLRLANILFSPFAFMDVKAGRQVLTWGTGDLVFINDLFRRTGSRSSWDVTMNT